MPTHPPLSPLRGSVLDDRNRRAIGARAFSGRYAFSLCEFSRRFGNRSCSRVNAVPRNNYPGFGFSFLFPVYFFVVIVATVIVIIIFVRFIPRCFTHDYPRSSRAGSRYRHNNTYLYNIIIVLGSNGHAFRSRFQSCPVVLLSVAWRTLFVGTRLRILCTVRERKSEKQLKFSRIFFQQMGMNVEGYIIGYVNLKLKIWIFFRFYLLQLKYYALLVLSKD